MAIKYICDICGSTSPSLSAMRTFKSDDRVIVQACLTCAQKIENNIKLMIGQAANAKEAEQAAKKPEEQESEVKEDASGRADLPQGGRDQTQSESQVS